MKKLHQATEKRKKLALARATRVVKELNEKRDLIIAIVEIQESLKLTDVSYCKKLMLLGSQLKLIGSKNRTGAYSSLKFGLSISRISLEKLRHLAQLARAVIKIQRVKK
jgi:hypothetical protein